jgi:1-acyl-sn-glycerol-3-phosphate acyltransferase
MKHFLCWKLGALASALICIAPLVSRADDYDKKTIITLDQPTEVPGIILAPGTYVIKLLNSSSNRHIAEIMNEKMDHLYALTFTAAAERVEPRGKTVVTFYEGTNGRPKALRKWFWPGDTIGQEFVYPKTQAAIIAADSKEKVPEGELPTVAESGQSWTPDNAKGIPLETRKEHEKH